jgi:hypothetical protein
LTKKPKINKINELRREENPNIFVEKTTTKFVGKPKTLGGGGGGPCGDFQVS